MDTGATCTMLPKGLLESLCVKPSGKEQVRLADGRLVEWDVGEAYVRYRKFATHTWVLFGESKGVSVLGALTLEELRLQVDPRSRRLRRIRVTLMASASGRDGRTAID